MKNNEQRNATLYPSPKITIAARRNIFPQFRCKWGNLLLFVKVGRSWYSKTSCSSSILILDLARATMETIKIGEVDPRGCSSTGRLSLAMNHLAGVQKLFSKFFRRTCPRKTVTNEQRVRHTSPLGAATCFFNVCTRLGRRLLGCVGVTRLCLHYRLSWSLVRISFFMPASS